MTSNNPIPKPAPRVMWLLNHTAARRFEVAMLKKIGINEIFLPKSVPNDPLFRSASVDFSEDKNLTIPAEDLKILNETDWYVTPSKKAWDIANRHFDILFFILLDLDCFANMVKNFKGSVVYRAYGVIKETINYANAMDSLTNGKGNFLATQMGNRFWYGHAYEHQYLIEKGLLRERSVYLPLGLEDTTILEKDWTGVNKQIFFVCPDIGLNGYYKNIYNKFIDDFKGLPYSIGGTQSLKVNDPNVLGFLSKTEHEQNMHTMRVMFYHSDEPNHVHYHPFEAIRGGMPLVFMAGGLLDFIGGEKLPGRCTTIAEARQKMTRILNDDWKLIHSIRSSQHILLEQMTHTYCEPFWQAGMRLLCDNLAINKMVTLNKPKNKVTRIAVIVPVKYRGGSLRGAKLLAQAIQVGAQQADKEVEVVFAHLDDPTCYSAEEFNDLPSSIKRRPFRWKLLNSNQANCALTCAGMEQHLKHLEYYVPDDGIQQFMDCDLWVFVSDRLEYPVLPIRPFILMVYDYLQRYQPLMEQTLNQRFITAAYDAESIWVTTEFTRKDAIDYTGLVPYKVHKLPMLTPLFSKNLEQITVETNDEAYFIWTTNLGMHKNHEKALTALRIYYEELQGKLDCRVTGVDTKNLLESHLPYFQPLKTIVQQSTILQSHLQLMGELPETAYQKLLAGAEFLWHAGQIDNGTFSVVEAAHLGVPALSSDYPAMHEINAQFDLNLSWMDANDPRQMAYQLKQMELESPVRRAKLPTREQLASQSVERLASSYWRVLEEYL